jgi:PAS domain S-box-containing protein
MQEKEIKTNRLLLALGTVVFFAWGYIYRSTLPGALDPPLLRTLGTALLAAILVLSYIFEKVKNNLSSIIYVILYVFTLYEIYLVYLNKVSPEFFIDYIVLIIIFDAYFRKPSHLLVYQFYSLALTVLVCVLTPDALTNAGFVISTIVSLDCLVFPIFSSRLTMQRKLAYSEDLMKSIYNESTDSLFLIHPVTGHILDCNHCSLSTFGYDNKQQVLNRHFQEQIQLHLTPAALSEIQRVVKDGEVWKSEVETREGDRIFWGDLALKQIQAGNQQLWLLRITDVTRRKLSELQLESKTRALESSNIELEQMAYVASHDLQEPLRSITSYVQLLQRRYKDKLDEEANEFITYTVDGAERMRSLIQDLLTYSRIGAYNKKIELVDCGRTINIAIRNMLHTIREKKAEIQVSPGMPQLLANEFEMLELFQNLISNGIKFNDKTPVLSISVEPVTSGPDKGREENITGWKFAVKDNGIGIKPEYRDRIFRIFQRLHPRDHYSGTGIGLAICKKVVEKYGGKIWVDSVPGEGSTFYFTLYKKHSGTY